MLAPQKDAFASLKAQALRRAGMMLFPPAVALAFIQLCGELDIELVGFDGFRMLPKDKIQPMLEHCLDLSDQRHAHLSRKDLIYEAKDFVRARIGKEIVFEMVTGPDV